MVLSLFNRLKDVCSGFDSDRLKLEFWKDIKKLVSNEIDNLISDEKGQKYNTAFRISIMNNIYSANPDISSYVAYNKYSTIRKEIISELGISYNTAMLTKDEYERCTEQLKEYERDISNEK